MKTKSEMKACGRVAGTLVVMLLVASRTSFAQLDAASMQALLDTHNELRRGVDVPCTASNMRKVRWSSELARVAQAYAERCTWAHNPDRFAEYGKGVNVGENLFAYYDGGEVTRLERARLVQGVVNWVDKEVEFYDYDTGACEEGQMCGHYTQVVWAKTAEVGCGAASCATMKGWRDQSAILVCNYADSGNYVGQKPFLLGKPCSACPDACEDGLCTEAVDVCEDKYAQASLKFNGVLYNGCAEVVAAVDGICSRWGDYCRLSCGELCSCTGWFYRHLLISVSGCHCWPHS